MTDAASDEAIPGVNVVVEGTTTGTTTDLDGEYELELPSDEAVLVFSFVGYVTQEIAVEGREVIDVALEEDIAGLEEVMVVGYGTVERSDLTGSVDRMDAERLRDQSVTNVSEMLSGTIAGFAANQSTDPAGGTSLQIRGQNSLTAGTEPLIVVDDAIFHGSLRDINPADVESIDILKDASSAAVYGAKAASGVVLITTTSGGTGKPTINYSSRLGVTQPTNERRPLGPEEYIQFRTDYFRTVFPERPYHFYTNPEELPDDVSLEEWRSYSDSPLPDDTREYLSRLRFFPEEVEQYQAGETIDWYDVVMRRGLRQTHDMSISGGTDDAQYYWSLGYVDNEGLRVGQDYSAIQSRLNGEYQIVDWLSAGMNTQFSRRDESSVPASMNFYVNSPYGTYYDEEGNIKRRPHGHSNHPLLNYYRQDRQRHIHTIFSNVYADIELPYGFSHRVSFQPRYETLKDLSFTSTDPSVGGEDSDTSQGVQDEYSQLEWIVDNILSWNREFGAHGFDVTLLHSVEQNREWATTATNQNFAPTEQLGFHGLHFGDNPSVVSDNLITTGESMMARVNYSLLSRYLFTATIRRDGYSAFGQQNPRATFPALAFAWQIGDEPFFNVDWINTLKLRLSWGENGNRDIGPYSALSHLNSNVWYDGQSTRIGLYNSTLSNPSLRWEETESFNIGLDVGLFQNRIDLALDVYDANTTNLLLSRQLPTLTGYSSVTSNLGKLQNRGLEMTVRTINVDKTNLNWRSDLVFSLNRNKIVSLFGDYDEEGNEVPDLSNNWFPGEAIDAVWDYELIGVWQEDEREEAEAYGMRPGDFKAVDVNGDGSYSALDDKQFIGHREPRYRIGFGNDISFLENWSASIFIRADLGHIGAEPGALNPGAENNDRRSRNVGPMPYWTPENPIDDYARLDVNTSGYGGGIQIYRPRSFVRIQDLTLSYDIGPSLSEVTPINSMRLFGSVRNLATFTKWPHWDPESGDMPMPRTFTLGLNVTL